MILFLFSLLFSFPARAQDPAPYERRELTIPMRDGTMLFAVALIPTQQQKTLPIILIRTPFDAGRVFRSTEPPAYLKELAEDG